MTVGRGVRWTWLQRLLIALLLGPVIGLVPGRPSLARASSVDSPAMLPDDSCTTALSTGVLAFTLGSQFPSGTTSVCAIVLTDAGASDTVGVTIYNSAGTVVAQRSAASGRIDFGGIGNLVYSGLTYQGTAGGAWPDDSYRTDISLNGAVGTSVNWTVGAGAPLVATITATSAPTATIVPSTATIVPPTITPLPPTSTPLPATATVTPVTTAPVSPTVTATLVAPTATATLTATGMTNDPKALVLSRTDVPAGFTQSSGGYVSNATAAKRDDLRVRDEVIRGRYIGYEAEFVRHAAKGLVDIFSGVEVYTSATTASAHLQLRKEILTNISKDRITEPAGTDAHVVSAGAVGAARFGFYMTQTEQGVRYTWVGIYYQRGRYYGLVVVGGKAGTFDRSEAFAQAGHLASLVDGRFRRALPLPPFGASPMVRASAQESDFPAGYYLQSDDTRTAAEYAVSLDLPLTTVRRYGVTASSQRIFSTSDNTSLLTVQITIYVSPAKAHADYLRGVASMKREVYLSRTSLPAIRAGDEWFGRAGVSKAHGSTAARIGVAFRRGSYVTFIYGESSSLDKPLPPALAVRLASLVDARIQHLLAASNPQAVSTPTATAVTPTAVATSSPLTDPTSLNPAQRHPAVGSVAPDFDLATVGGTRYRLSALHGHPVVLEFFAIWCPHCQHEAPILTRLERQYGPRGLLVLGILASPYGKDYETAGTRRLAERSDVAWFTTTFHVGHPILIDPHFAVVNRYGVNAYSTIFVVDTKGVIRFAGTGEVGFDALATAVQAAEVR